MPTIITRGAMSAQGFGFNRKAGAADSYWWSYLARTSTNLNDAQKITSDSSGNIYIVGKNTGVIYKFDSAGTLQYQKQFGGGGQLSGITTDSSSNVYFTFKNGHNAVLVKLDSTGAITWQKSITGDADNNMTPCKGISVDSSGNIYFVVNIQDSTPSDIRNAVFKFNSSGTIQWQRYFYYNSSNAVMDLALDTSANVYLIGYYDGSSGGGVAKFNTSGTYQSFYYIYLSPYEGGYVDASGNIYGCNTFAGNVIKLSSAGAITWQKRVTGTSQDAYYSVYVDSSSNVYVSGYSRGGVSTGVITSLDSSGAYRWRNTVSVASRYGQMDGISMNSAGTLLASGYYKGPSNERLIAMKVPADGTKTGTFGDLVYASVTPTLSTTSFSVTTPTLTNGTSTYSVTTPTLTFANTSDTTATTAIT